MAAIANLSIDQGATFTSDVTVKDANGNAFDLTGYTARAKLAKGYQSTQTRQDFTTTISWHIMLTLHVILSLIFLLVSRNLKEFTQELTLICLNMNSIQEKN